MDRGRLNGRSIREETITDLMMACLAVMRGNSLHVSFPNEPTTGADMEWNFVSRDLSSIYCLYIQAKREYGTGKIWQRYSYRELYHQTGNPKKFQADTLVKNAKRSGKGCMPLYAFYHSQQTCDWAATSGCKKLMGVNLASGFVIQSLVQSSIANQGNRLKNRKLATIQPHLFKLTDLLCPSPLRIKPILQLDAEASPLFHLYGALTEFPPVSIPSPTVIKERLERIIGNAGEGSPGQSDSKIEVPSVSNEVPSEILSIAMSMREGMEPPEKTKLDRWRVVFLESEPLTLEIR